MPCSRHENVPLWVDDVSILWRDAFDFFPMKPKSDGNARVNAIARFCIYAAVILAIYKKSPIPLMYGGGILLLATFLHVRSSSSMAALKSRMVNGQTCRKPSVKNPYMNNPVVELSDPKEPCYDQVEESDAYANIGVVKDMDDILRDRTENRAFFTLPGGGGPPDFSKLSQTLGREMEAEDCPGVNW